MKQILVNLYGSQLDLFPTTKSREWFIKILLVKQSSTYQGIYLNTHQAGLKTSLHLLVGGIASNVT